MLCGWDGEESGLIGSIEHVEEYYSQLHDKAIAYINIDSAVYGKFCSVIYLKVAWKSKLIFWTWFLVAFIIIILYRLKPY